MSDSDKTNELDNYGVWVKKPPRTVSSELGEENTNTLSLDNDLPSFDSIDVVDTPLDGTDPDSEDATLSADELANITGSLEEGTPVQEGGESSSTGETEEISLDEFIEGGVFEGDDNSAPASSEPSPSEAPQAEESVSADEFMESSDITISDAPSISDAPALSEDGPIDIDLSFDDSDSAPSMGSPAASSAPVKEVAGSEEVDLSDFGVDFGSDEGSSSEPAAPSNDGTESVDLSDFGVDFGDGDSSAAGSSPAEEPAASEPVVNDDGTEEVSLDSFGFDINSDEPKAEEPASESTSTIIAEENPSLDSDERTLTINDNISVGSDDDDDIGNISLDSSSSSSESQEPEEEQPVTQEFTTQDSDDFDLDSIMDSIEDENGNKSSLISEQPAVAEPSIEEPVVESFTEEPVISEEPEEEPPIPETLEETEPVVNDVVDMDEPVFEETAVDLPESVSEEITESDNPFTLPPDDAFAPVAAEEPVIEETLEQESIEEPVSEEAPAFDEPVTEEEPAITEDVAVPVSETEAQDAPEPVKQDEEINSAANNILNQIAAELSSLRNEISNLKSEFEELKNKEPAPAPVVATEEVHEEPQESESSGGFFGTEDEDDTIALSLDEMDNILNTVEIVEEAAPTLPETTSSSIEEPAEESAEPELAETENTEESLDFSNESIEEPVLDDIDTNIADEEEELPEEILLPKSEDDILVESSTDNLIEEESEAPVSIEDSAEDIPVEEVAEEPESTEDVSFEIADTTSDEASDATLVDEPFVFDEAETATDEPQEDENDATLSADELANIAADSSTIEEAPGEELEDEETESESSIPSVSDILGDSTEEEESSGISISEGELDNLLSSEAALAEQNRKLAEEEEKAEPVHSSIPGDLQKEIKSVLSYMDQLLENLPEEKIAEFAQSEQFETYKKLFKELGLD